MPPVKAEFRRQHRILEAKHFKRVFDNRIRLHSKFFSFHLLPNGEEFHRLGLAVSKKVSKKAVERNRIKRQIRESFRHFQFAAGRQECVAGFDFVVVAKTTAGSADNASLKFELDHNWIKARDKCAK